jgi:dephospho-CoA kinase
MYCVIGITGPSGSGKSFVAKKFEDRGFLHIDADKYGHQALEDAKHELASVFGTRIISSGKVDRRELGEIVFSSPEKLAKLEEIVFPVITENIKQDIADCGCDVIIDGVKIAEAGLDKLCSAVIFVKAPVIVRFLRALRRGDAGFHGVVKRFWAQRKISCNKLQINADKIIVRNFGNSLKLEARIDEITNRLVKNET